MGESEQPFTNVLDTFDHVVVLMLENRSFDNLLGYLYPQNSGLSFDGVDGKNLSNPIPSQWQFNDGKRTVTEVCVAPIDGKNIDLTKCAPPYPDPGEDYPHVNAQLFYNPANPSSIANPPPVPYNTPPYNLPSPVPQPMMTGFVTDYIENFVANEMEPAPSPGPMFYDQYKYVMQSYDPADIPVFSGLAREFAVFDHWFCSVPSETICNRNFWHAGTSWGHVINPGPRDDQKDDSNLPNTLSWLLDTRNDNLFRQISVSTLNFKIYSDNKIPIAGWTLSLPVTPLLHLGSFVSDFDGLNPNLYGDLEGFKNDCANGQLPAYSFIEPNFFNPHNDMHPSTPKERIDGDQDISSVLLGEALVWDVYNAIFTSPHHWKNTLLIITFDEHGGCYDHVCPPGSYGGQMVEPCKIAAPPELGFLQKEWDGFDFNRLGLRVPTIMVSPYIKKNTIINEPMSHSSFLRTMHAKWGGASLSARENASPCFHDCGLLSPTLQRDKMPTFPKPVIPAVATDSSQGMMSPLAQAITSLLAEAWCMVFPEALPTTKIKTQERAAAFFSHAVHTAKIKLGQVDAVKDRIDKRDWISLLKAIAGELKNKKMLR